MSNQNNRNRPGQSSRNNNSRSSSRGGNGGQRGNAKATPKKLSLVDKVLIFFGFKEKPTTGNKGKGKGTAKKTPTKQPVTTERLFIGNLSYKVTEEELADFFKTAGTVKKAEIATHSKSKRPKGYGFITMGSVAEAEKAAATLDGKALDGREVTVTGAKSANRSSGPSSKKSAANKKQGERRDRPQGDGRRGGGERGGRGGRNERSGGGRGGRGGRGSKADAESTVTPMEVPTVSTPMLTISNLTKDFGEAELGDLFYGVGDFVKSDLKEGLAMIEMKSVDDAQQAVRLLDGKDFMGQTLSVKGDEDVSSWASTNSEEEEG